ncbi:hypothetical protein MNBD_IGNAVI01-2084 [hydrothermal vent metagenome]|uniref:Uncharacterized protein n=1 Tax=hydrothermal vent metagenome TaxID=652676 RepID=A0A3B1BN45_9ZZZZ
MFNVKNVYKKVCKIISFLIIAVLVSFSVPRNTQAQVSGAQFDTQPMHWARYWARAVFDRNLVYTPLWNIGNITDAGVTPHRPLRWPGSEGLSYAGSANFFIGAYVTDMSAYKGKQVPDDRDGKQFGIVSNAYLPHVSTSTVAQLSSDRSHQQIWQPFPGFYNDGFYGYIWGINEDTNRDGVLDPSEDVNYNGELDYNLDPPPGILKSMAISTDKRTWPEYWPGGSYVGDDRLPAGRPPKTSGPGQRAGQWNGEYKAAPIADQESLYMMDDHENDFWNDYKAENYWPMKNPDGTPDTTEWNNPNVNKVAIAGSGVEIESRTYGWFHPLAEDLLVSVYRVRNYSDYDLNRVVTGMWADPNIVQGNFNAADYIVATYGVGDEGRLEFDVLYVWHKFPEQLNTFQKVGVFGFGFLESPGIDYNGIDDDKDGMIDESMSDGIDNDGDWRPFEDIGIEDLPGTRGNGIWDTEDTNLNGGLDPGEDVNKNDKLDFEPVNDDRGTDGIGPDENGWPGPDPDGTETNGSYEIGEPNFDITDIDEADQAGLEHVFVYESNKVLRDQKGFWDKYISKPGQNIEDTDENIVFLFGAKDVKLETIDNLQQASKPEWKRFTITLLMGEDKDDIVRNKSTMQSIYNNNYRFLTPPLQPTLVANVSNKKVQLYWDSDAEYSKDPFFGFDFNGYRLYKSTDPDFLDIKTVTDAFGNVLLFEPLEIFDRADDHLKGAHPIPFPNLGVHYDMGKNSGLRHSYVDTLVENGRTYYYAVSSIDAGNDWDFYELGLVTVDYPLQAMPSESPFNITVNELGEVVFRDKNTAVCTPQEPAAGYTEPFIDSSKIDHVSGFARGGKMNIDVFNKYHATDHLGEVYELTFKDDNWLDSLTPDYQWGSTRGITCINKTTGDTLFDQTYGSTYEYLKFAAAEVERGVYEGINFDVAFPINYRDDNKGISIIKYDKNGRYTNAWRMWSTDTKSNLRVQEIGLTGASIALPRDFDIRVYDHVVDTSYAPPPTPPIPPTLFAYPLKFAVWDVTDPNNEKKMKITVVYDKDKVLKDYPDEMFGQIWDSTRITIRFRKPATYTGNDKYYGSWQIRFIKNVFDSLHPTIPPGPGDVYKIRTERNPTHLDTFLFKAEGGTWKAADVQTEGKKKVYVVPDPYVGANTLETKYELAGNSQRRVDFVNLPPKCTIYIFTAAGELVKKIYHEGALDEGREPWDLTAEDGPEVAFGMYFFVVEAEGLDTQRGKFAIIK